MSEPQQVCCAQRGQVLRAARQWENFYVPRPSLHVLGPSLPLIPSCLLPLLGPWPWVPVSRKEAYFLQGATIPHPLLPFCSTILLVPLGTLEFLRFLRNVCEGPFDLGTILSYGTKGREEAGGWMRFVLTVVAFHSTGHGGTSPWELWKGGTYKAPPKDAQFHPQCWQAPLVPSERSVS